MLYAALYSCLLLKNKHCKSIASSKSVRKLTEVPSHRNVINDQTGVSHSFRSY